MPRFFIDTSDQEHFVRDDIGHECLDLDHAKTLAVDALPDMAREALPGGDDRTFLALVRGEDDRALLQCSLTLHVTAPGGVLAQKDQRPAISNGASGAPARRPEITDRPQKAQTP